MKTNTNSMTQRKAPARPIEPANTNAPLKLPLAIDADRHFLWHQKDPTNTADMAYFELMGFVQQADPRAYQVLKRGFRRTLRRAQVPITAYIEARLRADGTRQAGRAWALRDGAGWIFFGLYDR